MPTKPHPKLLSWATDLDDKTLDQARRSSELPFVHSHVALMPDAHFGYGATVGSVIPTVGAIIPSAVGVDIGCGMHAQRLHLSASDLPDNLDPLHSMIAEAIPAGVGKGFDREEPTYGSLTFRGVSSSAWSDKLKAKAWKQYGTLGSGNHFVEVCLDTDDQVWLMLHSGSRGVGNELANFHIDGAKDLMKRYFIDLEDPDLAFLTEGTTEFGEYIDDMLWAQDYASGNRSAMMQALRDCVRRFLDRPLIAAAPGQDAFSVNCHHNYTAREYHHGRNVWVTRKGAIRAREGDWGVIPGSMGTKSYIVQGLGHPASFQSCSHGAGRRMSRNQARKTLDTAGLEAAMEGKAWNHDAKSLIDEDPRAYKPIDEVMAAQADLVEVRYELRQILSYKGT